MRRFVLYRDEDETGVSGTGVVAEGVQFTDGTCSMRWRATHTSTAVYDGVETLEAIHGHNGRTRILWSDPIEHDGQCPAVAVLVAPFEANQCWMDHGHDGQHQSADSAGTTLLWRGQAVHYPQCICGVGAAEAAVCPAHSDYWRDRR